MVRCSLIRSFRRYDDKYLYCAAASSRDVRRTVYIYISVIVIKKNKEKLRADKIQTSIYLVFNALFYTTNIKHTLQPHSRTYFHSFSVFITWQWLWWCMLWVLAASVTTAVAGRHEGTWDVVYFFLENIIHTHAPVDGALKTDAFRLI